MNLLSAARERLTAEQFRDLERNGSLVLTQRHSRPLYFDGRFLDARSLTQEQTYFLTRQAVQGRAMGTGVVFGLDVSEESATSLRITAGQGITPTGEMVVLGAETELSVTDVATTHNLNAAFGLRRVPGDPPRARTGLFVLAVRAVEYTANPVASFPTTAGGDRTVRDGDVIEAAAITLIPYPEQGGEVDLNRRRALVAREIFVEGVEKGIPAGALPIAVVALQAGSIVWVDQEMVRRFVGAGSPFPNFGLAPRALREAHFAQYDQHFQDVVTLRDRLNRGARFSAAEHFAALPPGGRMPAAAVDGNDFSQIYFPHQLDVELSITPEDEIAGLLAESLLLPPIDLLAPPESLESTAVLAMIPVPRARFEEFVRGGRLREIVRPLKAAIPGVVSLRRPIEALQLLRAPRVPAPTPSDDAEDAVWREALDQSPFLWFVRKRDIPYRLEISTIPVVAPEDTEEPEPPPTPPPDPGDGVIVSDEVLEVLRRMELADRVVSVLRASDRPVATRAADFLSQRALLEAPLLMAGAAVDLTTSSPLTQARLSSVVNRYRRDDIGRGIARVRELVPELTSDPSLIRPMAATGLVLDLDELAIAADDRTLAEFARPIADAARRNDENTIRGLIERLRARVSRPDPTDIRPAIEERMRELGQVTRFRSILSNVSPATGETVMRALSDRGLSANPLLVESFLSQVEQLRGTDPAGLSGVIRSHVASGVGDGLNILAEREPAFFTNVRVVRTLGQSGRIIALDRMVRGLPRERVDALARRIIVPARTGDAATITRLIR